MSLGVPAVPALRGSFWSLLMSVLSSRVVKAPGLGSRSFIKWSSSLSSSSWPCPHHPLALVDTSQSLPAPKGSQKWQSTLRLHLQLLKTQSFMLSLQSSATCIPVCYFGNQWTVAYVKTMTKMYKTYEENYKFLLKDVKENLDKDFLDEDTILQRCMEK